MKRGEACENGTRAMLEPSEVVSDKYCFIGWRNGGEHSEEMSSCIPAKKGVARVNERKAPFLDGIGAFLNASLTQRLNISISPSIIVTSITSLNASL